MLYAWLTRKTSSARKNRSKQRAGQRSRLALERLEDRRLLSVATTTTLSVSQLGPLTYGDTEQFSVAVVDSTSAPATEGVVHLLDTTSTGMVDLTGAAGVNVVSGAASISIVLPADTHSVVANYTDPNPADPNNAYDPSSGALASSIVVNPLHITGDFTVSDKPYDGTTAATVLTETTVGDVGGVTLNGGTANFDTADVGTGKTVTLTGATLGGADAGDYILDSVANTTASVSALHITGDFTVSDKPYDGTTAATVLTESTVGDVGGVTLNGGTATFDTADAGTGKTVTLTGATLGGGDAGDYILDSVANTTASITPASLTVTATGIDRMYNGTTNARVTLADNRVTGDDVTVTYATASFADPNVGTAKPVTVTGIAITGGANAADYTLANDTATTTADIAARVLKVQVSAEHKFYDGTTAATVTLSDHPVAGNVVTLSYTAAAFADANAGRDIPVTVSGITISGGTDPGNYVLASDTAGTTSRIKALPITVTANPQSKVYDGSTTTDPALTYQITSGSLIGNDTLTGALSRAAGENGGQYAIRQGTLTADSNYKLEYVKNYLTIVAAPTSTSLQAVPAAAVYGQLVTLSAVVTDTNTASPATPTGKVVFQATVNGQSRSLGQGMLTTDQNGNLVATVRYTPSQVGQYTISATFSDGRNFITSSATTTLTITPAPTTTGLVVTTKGSGTAQKLVFTASVGPTAANPLSSPKGEVLFLETDQSGNVLGTLGTGNVSGGQAQFTCSAASLGAGTYYVEAEYVGPQSGPANYQDSTSAVVTVNVTLPTKTATPPAAGGSINDMALQSLLADWGNA